MSIKNVKIPLKIHDMCLSFTEHKNTDKEGRLYSTYEIGLMGTNERNEFVLVGQPLNVYDLMGLFDILYTVAKLDDWTYFTDQYEVELQPELELVIDNDNKTE